MLETTLNQLIGNSINSSTLVAVMIPGSGTRLPLGPQHEADPGTARASPASSSPNPSPTCNLNTATLVFIAVCVWDMA